MTAAAISGCFADYRLVKSRSVLQLVVEVPVERQEEAFAALGYPVPGAEIHVALARLVTTPEPKAASDRSIQGRARYAASTERQQALVRSAQYPKDARFRKWAVERGYEDTEAAAIEFIRYECDVKSRREIEENDGAHRRFLAMETDYKIWAGLLPEVR